MSNHKIIIPRASNKEIVEFLKEFSDILKNANISIHEFGSYQAREFATTDEYLSGTISRPDKYTIIRAHAFKEGYGVRFISGSENAQNPDFNFDKLEFDFNTSTPNVNLSGKALEQVHNLVDKYFLDKARHATPLFGNPKAFQNVISSHQSIITRLESSLASVAENFSKERLALEAKNAEYREQIETKHDALREKLESDYQEKHSALKRAEEDLEERKKQLDDRDNTHARRKIREDLKRRIDEHSRKFQLTTGTRRLRAPIHISALLSLALLGSLIGYYGYGVATTLNASSGLNEILLIVIKPLGLTIAFLGLLTWYLRWMNRWFERHSEAEFQLKQFELDIDRASWVVETALEWRHEQHAAMPDHLIESISRNLFSKSEKDEGADMHPADYLASALLGRASGLRLKLPGGEIEYGAKALKEARPSTDKA